ncbi:MAG: hypothetical protein U0531_15045 [Dehalococcoidia bacterium]
MTAILLTDERRTLFRHRLLRQAWLLDRMNDAAARDQALATAAAIMAPADELAKQFRRRLIERSVAQALNPFPLLFS